MKRILSVVLVLGVALAAWGADTRGYVQEGLIAHWDGIENAGRGTHDAAATAWVDLVAGRRFALTGVTVGDDRLTFAGSGSSYGALPAADAADTFDKVGAGGTIEVVLKADNANNAIALQSANVALSRFGSRSIVFSGSSEQPMLEWCWDAVQTNTVSMIYKSALVQSASVNGASVAISDEKDFWSPSGSDAVIGTRQKKNNNHFTGSIYAIRLYNRQLTADEIAANAALDDLRFRQGESAAYENAIFVGCNQSERLGAKGCSTYGVTNNLVVGRAYTFTSSATEDTDISKTFNYQCLGWELKLADGTVTTNTAATVRNCTFTYSAAMSDAILTWRWGNRAVCADKTYYANAATGDDDNTGEDAAHPFKTIHAAHVATTNYLAQNGGKTALVSLGAGRYDVTNAIAFVAGERIVGESLEKTFVNLGTCYFPASGASSSFGLKLTSADNYLGYLSLTGLCYTANYAPKPLWVVNGLVDSIHSGEHEGGYQAPALGIYLLGGKAEHCVFTNNYASSMYAVGIGAHVNGGELTDSLVAYNTGNDSRYGNGDGVYLKSGAVRRCIIHHNGLGSGSTMDKGAGASVEGGTLENCIIYGNKVPSASNGAGLHVTGGTVRYCTVYGNSSGNGSDTTGVSGLYQNGGTVINCIIFGNAKAGGVVASGTCVTNLLDAAIAGSSVNTVTDDPCFTDAANADFTIAKRSSLAVGNAHPIAAVATDLAGIKRSAAPTIGAYEYDSSKETFAVALQIPSSKCLYGTKATANAVISGKDGATISIDWYVDGVNVPGLANRETVEIEGLGFGWHGLRVEATKGTDTKSDEVAKAVAVLPSTVYVNTSGDGTYPYATEATGTNDLVAALDALWQADDCVSRVDVGEGTFMLKQQLLVSYPVVVAGRGADKSILKGDHVLTRLVMLSNEKARLQDLGITGTFDFNLSVNPQDEPHGVLQLSKGTADRCRIFDSVMSCYDTRGGGVLVENGSLVNSVVTNCHSYNQYCYGGGVALTEAGGVVSNCVISHCAVRGRSQRYGAGAYVYSGLLTNCRITDCGNHADPAGVLTDCSNIGAGIYLMSGAVRNVLVDNCSSCADTVLLLLASWNGVAENCTVTACQVATNQAVVLVGSQTTLRNSVVWGNDCGTNVVTSSTVTYSCYPEATEGASGNTARNPKLRARHDYEISPFGSCYRAGAVQSWMIGATDLSGRPRTTTEKGVEKVDIGCHQVPPPKGAAFVVR